MELELMEWESESAKNLLVGSRERNSQFPWEFPFAHMEEWEFLHKVDVMEIYSIE